MTTLTWLGILLCLSQSALLSGMNLGLFSLSKLELEVAARKGDAQAKTVLAFRHDANFALVTILWGNVGVNVFLALLSNSVLNGLLAFLFSTVVITVFAEIMPQAYFSRHALRMAATLAPVLRIYQLLLYPLAKPTAMVLDWWLGAEGIRFYREKDLRRIIHLHMEDADSDIARMEGQGALNFLEIDDVPLRDEGEQVDPKSVLTLPFLEGKPQFPAFEPSTDDAFLRVINRSGKSWVVIVDTEGEPRLVLNANDFIRQALFEPGQFNPFKHCHRPIIVRNPQQTLGELMQRYRVRSVHSGDDIVDEDVILLWGEAPKVVTGTDILGRLLRGIARESKSPG